SELARALHAPPSSCFNLIRALQARGYLYSVQPRRQLYPTRRLFDVARAIVAGEPWMARVEPVLTQLRDQTHETIILGKRQGDRVVYLQVIEGPQSIRYTARAGDLKPLHSSAIGKALLGALTPAKLAELLKQLPTERVTTVTITDRSELLANLEQGRQQGYFVTRGENVADVMAVAATVQLDGDVYGIAVAGPIHRMESDLTKHVSALTAARAIMADLAHAHKALRRLG
ncbi:MAG: IclR family transcriptional regulator, partial [Deltaproteobacteria bacterium]|nr:IclR family transcriptional regulator [Deltaproteobacteria bacterium]